MNNRKVNNRGITLIELIIALAVLAMLMTAVIMMMSNNSVIYRKTKADINIQTTAQETFNTLQDSIMQAKEITIAGYVVTNPGKEDESVSANEVVYKNPAIARDDTSVTGFDKLKVVNNKKETTYTYIRPTKLQIKYSVKATDTLDNSNCVVTYYFCRYENPDYKSEEPKSIDNMPTRCNVYVTRKYDAGNESLNDMWDETTTSEDGEESWTPASTNQPTADQRKPYERFLFTSSLQDITFSVDYETQSIDIDMNFSDKSMTYHTSGIVSVRNSYVMNEQRDRKKIDVNVTETTTTVDLPEETGETNGDTNGSGEGAGVSGNGESGNGN